MTAGQLPEGRYGPRRAGRRLRWARPLGTALAVLVGLAVAVTGYRNLAQTPVDGRALGFSLLADQPDGHAVSLRFEVVRDDPARPAVCIVRARSRDGDETGRKEVYVPPTAGPVELTTVIRTSRPPVTAEVYGCSLQVPAYLVPKPG
ncbi:MAG: DUF4307 domain-containing protein [Pseudonocardiaceae bacterium]